MIKEFISYDNIRNDALILAHKIYHDGFVPDIIYCSLRGGACMANVISEYYKLVTKKAVKYAGVVTHSYSDMKQQGQVRVDGWTYPPENLKKGDKILLADDIFDSGKTANFLVECFIAHGIRRSDIKLVVHDYKIFTGKTPLPIQPDYWCRKFEIKGTDDNRWIHYMSHELEGLSHEELEEHYFKDAPELRDVLEPILGNK